MIFDLSFRGQQFLIEGKKMFELGSGSIKRQLKGLLSSLQIFCGPKFCFSYHFKFIGQLVKRQSLSTPLALV